MSDGTNGTSVKPTERKALGRGIKDILGDEREDIRTAKAIPDIIGILASLPDVQIKNVFDAVSAIRKTASRDAEEIERIGEELNQLERERITRGNESKRRGWFRR